MDYPIEQRRIAGVPALVIGEKADSVYLFVHGKMGCKEEALAFAQAACPAGHQVAGIDLPEHGSRKAGPEQLLPWTAAPEILQVYQALQTQWRHISLRATSIGAWLAMLALQQQPVGRALFVSPVVDMEALIRRMMVWAGVTEEQLRSKGEIATSFGETLSWQYLCWVREHPPVWSAPARILYAANDELIPRCEVDAFAARTGGALTVLEHSEHWLHTGPQLRRLREWEQQNL